jgi:orotate phosphoribosyltransferase
MPSDITTEAEELLKRSEALLQGHFLLSSGLHANRYFQCARIFVDPAIGTRMVELLVQQVPQRKYDAIVGPAMGGVIVAYELARQMQTRNVFTEREGGQMTLRRGFSLTPGAQALICEDVVTTGKSSLEVRDALQTMGVSVAGVACLVDRTAGHPPVGLPLYSVLSVEVPTWTAAECPQCAAGVPVVKPGSRA